ncbi:type IV toxin-antitoxin system AbiEi family antitoxin, partial [Thermodesulfobacteriota bacterium]
MKIDSEFDNTIKKALILCLGRVPFLAVEEIVSEFGSEDIRPDFLVKVRQQESEQVLVVEAKNNGQPRIARDAVNQVQRYLNSFPGAYGVFMAPYISPRAAEICKEDGVGYLDLAGNCRLCFDSVYIEQEGRPNVFAEKRDLRSLYSPKAERILRVLLNNPNKAWKTVDLADEARVSLGQVSNVKKLLVDRELVGTEKQGIILTEPEQLLRGWKENYSFRRNKTRDLYSLKSMVQIESDISEYCRRKKMKYAFTGFSGTARFAPSVRYNRATVYIEETDQDMITELSLKE